MSLFKLNSMYCRCWRGKRSTVVRWSSHPEWKLIWSWKLRGKRGLSCRWRNYNCHVLTSDVNPVNSWQLWRAMQKSMFALKSNSLKVLIPLTWNLSVIFVRKSTCLKIQEGGIKEASMALHSLSVKSVERALKERIFCWCTVADVRCRLTLSMKIRTVLIFNFLKDFFVFQKLECW